MCPYRPIRHGRDPTPAAGRAHEPPARLDGWEGQIRRQSYGIEAQGRRVGAVAGAAGDTQARDALALPECYCGRRAYSLPAGRFMMSVRKYSAHNVVTTRIATS